MHKREKDSIYEISPKINKLQDHRYRRQSIVLVMLLAIGILLNSFAYAQGQFEGFAEGMGFPADMVAPSQYGQLSERA